MTRMLRAVWWAVMSVLASASAVGADRTPAEWLTEGKLQSDLGEYGKAVAAFERVLADPGAGGDLRCEASTRAALARRERGDGPEAVAAAFERALSECEEDRDGKRLLAFAVTGVLPEAGTWERYWTEARLRLPRPGQPLGWLEMPGTDPEGEFTGQPISLEVRDGSFGDLLALLSAVTDLRYGMDPSLAGLEFTAEFSGVPWDELQARLLTAGRLVARIHDGWVYVVRDDLADLPAGDVARRVREAYASLELRSIALAVESHRRAGGTCPSVGAVEAAALTLELEHVAAGPRVDAVGRPRSTPELARVDPWGRPLRVLCDERGTLAVSAGSDGELADATLASYPRTGEGIHAGDLYVALDSRQP